MIREDQLVLTCSVSTTVNGTTGFAVGELATNIIQKFSEVIVATRLLLLDNAECRR